MNYTEPEIVIVNKYLVGYNICPITQSKIKINDLYMICDICHYSYHEDSLKIWLENHNNCPNCRSNWTNKTIYKNTEEAKKEHIMLPKKHLNYSKHAKQSHKKYEIPKKKKEKQLIGKFNCQKINKPIKNFYHNR